MTGSPGAAHDVAVTPDGSVVFVALDKVYRLNSNGSPDPAFGTGGAATVPSCRAEFTDVLVDRAGRVLVAGQAARADCTDYLGVIARLTPAGEMDQTWGEAGQARISRAYRFELSLTPQGGYVALVESYARGTTFVTFDSTGYGTFYPFAINSLTDLASFSDGSFAVSGGKYIQGSGDQRAVLARAESDFSPDPGFLGGSVLDLAPSDGFLYEWPVAAGPSGVTYAVSEGLRASRASSNGAAVSSAPIAPEGIEGINVSDVLSVSNRILAVGSVDGYAGSGSAALMALDPAFQALEGPDLEVSPVPNRVIADSFDVSFSSATPGATFDCAVSYGRDTFRDIDGRFEPCSSPFRVERSSAANGNSVRVAVRARGQQGATTTKRRDSTFVSQATPQFNVFSFGDAPFNVRGLADVGHRVGFSCNLYPCATELELRISEARRRKLGLPSVVVGSERVSVECCGLDTPAVRLDEAARRAITRSSLSSIVIETRGAPCTADGHPRPNCGAPQFEFNRYTIDRGPEPELTVDQWVYPESLNEARRRGVGARVKCSTNCRAKLELTVSDRTVRAFGLDSNVIGSKQAAIQAGGSKTIRARIDLESYRQFKAQPGKQVSYKALVTAKATGEKRATVVRSATLETGR